MWTSLISILLIMYLNLNFVELLCCPVYFQWDISGMIAILVDILMLLLNLYLEPLRLKFGNGPKEWGHICDRFVCNGLGTSQTGALRCLIYRKIGRMGRKGSYYPQSWQTIWKAWKITDSIFRKLVIGPIYSRIRAVRVRASKMCAYMGNMFS